MHVITQSLSAFPQNQKDDPNRCRHTGCLKCPRGLAWAGWGERWRIWVFAIWCPQLRTRPRWVGTKYEVPPHRKDKVSLERCYWRSHGLNQIVWGHVWKVGKTGKVQRFVGHSSQEEQNMAATIKLGAHKKELENRAGLYRKYFL
jgi:hypothetical protein